jgi:GAF domain-containing protein
VSHPASDREESVAALDVLRRVARATATARRLEADAESRLLQSVVDTAALLFEAEAASIALHELDPDRLVYRVAAGSRGASVVGLAVAPDHGIAGHVFTTGEAVASSDVATDMRWDQGTAARTGYLPRSIAAVPLVDEGRTIGVLQVLDKRSSASFSPRDMELLGVFARQAAAAIRAARTGRDSELLLRSAIGGVAGAALAAAAEQALVDAVARELDLEPTAYWRLVDEVAALRARAGVDVGAIDRILATVERHRLG